MLGRDVVFNCSIPRSAADVLWTPKHFLQPSVLPDLYTMTDLSRARPCQESMVRQSGEFGHVGVGAVGQPAPKSRGPRVTSLAFQGDCRHHPSYSPRAGCEQAGMRTGLLRSPST